MLIEAARNHASMQVPVVAPEDTAAEILRDLTGRRFESVAHLAVCRDRKFLGIIRIEDLLAAPGKSQAQSFMDAHAPKVTNGMDQEIAAWHAVQRGESGLAVVDAQGDFHGVIPPQRLLKVLLLEHEEDLSRLGGFMKSTANARATALENVLRRFGHRLPWLLFGLIGAYFAADFMGRFEGLLRDNILISFFIPGIVYLADAIGTQTETVIVRGLSVGVKVRQTIVRELLTGLTIGAVLAAIAYPFILWRWGQPQIAVGVSLSLFSACSTATIIAMILPWGLSRCGVDPAFGAGPLATVIQDILSILIYFAIVTHFA